MKASRFPIPLILFFGLVLGICGKEPVIPLEHGYATQGPHVLFGGKRIDEHGAGDFRRFRRQLRQPALNMAKHPDAETFKALSPEYTKDANMVYYKWISPGRWWVVEIPAADPATFQVVGFNLGKDKDSVWWFGQEQHGPDPATLELVNDGFVWKDDVGVWYQHEMVAGAHAPSFRHVGGPYYADTNHVYWGQERIAGADIPSFKLLGEGSNMGCDKGMVYMGKQPQPWLDPGSVSFFMSDPYGYTVLSDKNGVYVNGLKFLRADAKDFNQINKTTFRGKDAIYHIDLWHGTPVTLRKDKAGTLIFATILYDQTSREPQATLRGDVGANGLRNAKLTPPPGEARIGNVPKRQVDKVARPELLKRLRPLGALLDEGF